MSGLMTFMNFWSIHHGAEEEGAGGVEKLAFPAVWKALGTLNFGH